MIKYLCSHALFLLLCFNIIATNGFAQLPKQYEKKGDEAFAQAQFIKAHQYYSMALESQKTDNLLYKSAISASRYRDDQLALMHFKKIKRSFPLLPFEIAQVQIRLANYHAAEENLSKFVTNGSDENELIRKAKQQLEGIRFIQMAVVDSVDIQLDQLGKAINSDYSDVSAQYLSNQTVLFSSERSNQQSSIYKVEINAKRVKPIASSSTDNLANPFYDEDLGLYFFSKCCVCETENKQCEIYVTTDLTKGNSYKRLSINKTGFNNSQPTTGRLPNGKTILLFSSNRSGGFGGMDVWYAELNLDGQFENPINAGAAINTPGDELSPFYNSKSQLLYFSSNWHYGLGEQDIFEATNFPSVKDVRNLGAGINSSYDDLYFRTNEHNKKALLTSNRIGSKYVYNQGCCYDIYSFDHSQPYFEDSIPALDSLISVDSINLPPLVNLITTDQQLTSIIAQLKDRLPVTVYFHNDEPDPDTNADSTNLNYKDCFDSYSPLLSEYKFEYAKLFTRKTDKASAKKTIEAFFESEVEQGMLNLFWFANNLVKALREGASVNLQLEGYCSPLAKNAYNIQLSQRRIASLKNFFSEYKKGVLLPFIKNGSLRFTQLPFGEERADMMVDDTETNKPASVYGVSASQERKVAIIAVEIE